MRLIGIAVVLLLTAGCRADEPSLERMYPSEAFSDAAKAPVTLMSNQHNEVHLFADRRVSLRFVGEDDEPAGIVVRLEIEGDYLRLIGMDPRGIYAPFSFAGSMEELFGFTPEGDIEADIQLETTASQAVYTLEHMSFCEVGD